MAHGDRYESPSLNAGLPPMNRFLVPILLAAVIALPASAQSTCTANAGAVAARVPFATEPEPT